MAVSSVQVAITILLVTTWFILAVWALFRSRRSSQRARAARAWALRLRALISTTPGAISWRRGMSPSVQVAARLAFA
ncbi:hypothetical protein E6W36_02300 [Hankyongella ginsenosidimutans]|uniref:Uncharacterized protein n=1 Tax=Hankyongella ginsenosidimutans TaxID=1763828 RepID=A0A4D7C5I9_9SPHN|nr:hypothetical protein [Hankyongella ginsenosidimutans]QCI78855.1 hypothetical protein E6W36_02300 [Hankyongella ginsenosidimutans]